jgi:hypothetical protein
VSKTAAIASIALTINAATMHVMHKCCYTVHKHAVHVHAMDADGRQYTQTVIEGMLVRFFNYDRNGAGGINAGKQVRMLICQHCMRRANECTETVAVVVW